MMETVTQIGIGGILALLVIREFRAFARERSAKPNGNIIHKSFADEEDRYWGKMKDVVTAPLANVLEGTNKILGELRDRAIKEEGRREAEERARIAGAGR